VDSSYLDIQGRVDVMLKLRGFLCSWSSHDSHKAGYELLPTTSCCVSRMSNSVIQWVKLLVKQTRHPAPSSRAAHVDCSPWDVVCMLGSGDWVQIPIFVNENLVMRDRAGIPTFVKSMLELKVEVALQYPEGVPSMIIGTHEHPGVWISCCSGRLLALFDVQGMGPLYLDPNEASLIQCAKPGSLHADITEAYPCMTMCNGVRTQLGYHIIQSAVARSTLCTEGVTRLIHAPDPTGLTEDNVLFDSVIRARLSVELHPSATLDAFAVSRRFCSLIMVSSWFEVPESDVLDGVEPGCSTGLSVGSSLFPNAPRGCVLCHTSVLKMDWTYHRVNVIHDGLTEGCKLSIGDIKGTIVIDNDLKHCDIILSRSTFMKKSATGLLHEHLCHTLGKQYNSVEMSTLMEHVIHTASRGPNEPVVLNTKQYVHDKMPETKLSYVPKPNDSHLEGDGT